MFHNSLILLMALRTQPKQHEEPHRLAQACFLARKAFLQGANWILTAEEPIQQRLKEAGTGAEGKRTLYSPAGAAAGGERSGSVALML